MARNSLFAVLLRSPWWISLAIAAVMVLMSVALLPADWRVVGASACLPFLVLSGMAAWRQRDQPSPAEVARTREHVSAMAWPEFSALLESALQREGYVVRRAQGPAADFELERQGRRALLAARRWKSARTGLETLRGLQAAREAADVEDAICVALGEPTDTARPYAQSQRIELWGAQELARMMRRSGR